MIVDLCIGFIVVMLCLERLGLRHWAFRWPQYFLRQIAVVLFLLILVKVIWREVTSPPDLVILIAANLVIIFAIWRLYRYTHYGPRSVPRCKDAGPAFTVLITNVQYDNPRHDRLVQMIARVEPDIVVVLELTPAWNDTLAAACAHYPHRHTIVREDPFGLGIWSRYDIASHRVYSVYNSYPTMRCVIRIHDRDVVMWIMHPVPPAPGDASTSEPKDTEFSVVSRVIDGENNRTVVVGDLNDVAWSTATRKFIQRSRLRDPRRGRGFINTFPTYASWLGFPLDQIFVSKHFCISRFEKLENIGSDHFPLFAELVMDT